MGVKLTGRSPPRIPGAEGRTGPVEVVDYGHGEDRSKQTPPMEDPWAKDAKSSDDPWRRDSRPSVDPWDRSDR